LKTNSERFKNKKFSDNNLFILKKTNSIFPNIFENLSLDNQLKNTIEEEEETNDGN